MENYTVNDVKWQILQHLGPYPRPDFDHDSSRAAVLVNDNYELELASALDAYDWSFKHKEGTLADPAHMASGPHRFRFALPSDMESLVDLEAFFDERRAFPLASRDYRADDSYLYADAPALYIRYVTRRPEYMMRPYFVKYFALAAAASLCLRLGADPDRLKLLDSEASREFERAANNDSRADGPAVADTSAYIDV